MIKTLALFTFVCAIFLSAGQSAKAQKVDQPLAKQVSVNGTTIRYWEQGRGPTVIFVHGAYSDHRIWEAQREVVAKNFRFIALDLRYFGAAPWSDDGKHFNVATHAADVAALIRALNVGPVHLVGRSWGAITSLAVAIRHPELVRGLFLNEPGIASAVTDPEEQKLLAEIRKCIGPVAAAAKAGNDAEAVKLFFECTHNQPGGFAKLPEARRVMLLDNARTVALQVDPARAPRLTCAQLGEIKAPVEITQGELTRPFYQITVGAVHRCIPGSRLITIKGATHSAPTQNSSAFNNALLAFLDARRDSEPQQPGQPVAKQVSVNGTTIRYWEQGRGVPVAFVHGAISDHRYWEPQREAIAKHYRFIAVDRRYFGTAPWPDRGAQRSRATDVADLAAFIRELKVGPMFLVGSSGGSSVSLVTAVQHPELVRGLFLNEPGLPGVASIVSAPADQKVLNEFRADPRGGQARTAAKAGKMEEAARLTIDLVNGQPGTFDSLSPARKAMHVDNARTLTLNDPTPEPVTCAQLGELKIPVTITKGELTKPPSKIAAEAAHRCISGSQLITIPAANHGAPWQNSSAFNKELHAFLSAAQSKAYGSAKEMQVKKLRVNDVQLAYVEEGKGETVVFVHGGLGDWRTWEPLRPFISKRYHYVSLSRRYHYPNPWADDGRKYSQSQHVEDLAAFIRALNHGKVHLVGNSSGGDLVAYVALKYPGLVRSVVIGESGGIVAPTSAEHKASVVALQEATRKAWAAAEAGDPKQAAILHFEAVVGELGAFHRLPPEHQKRMLDNAKTLGLRQPSGRISVTCEQWRALSVPALLIRGENTIANYRYAVEAQLDCLPKTTKLAVIPGGNHAWFILNPEAGAKAILSFMDN